MKKTILILSVALLSCCGQPESKDNSENSDKQKTQPKDSTGKKITFYKVHGKAMVIGNDVKLLDSNFREIKDISFLNEQFVDVTDVSHDYHKTNPADNYCQEFKYVKIKTKDVEGYVNGRNLYEPIKHTQNKTAKIDDNEISFTATSYFGIGVSDKNGLTGCSINTPVVFSDKKAKYEGLIKMVKNKNYESDYLYFELLDDDGAGDEILSIGKQDDKYILKIKRIYQEDGAKILVSIYKDKSGTFVAEITMNERTTSLDNWR